MCACLLCEWYRRTGCVPVCCVLLTECSVQLLPLRTVHRAVLASGPRGPVCATVRVHSVVQRFWCVLQCNV